MAHSIALDPNKRQSEYFARAAGTARFAYNNALEMQITAYKADGKANPGKLRQEFNATRKEKFPWMGEVSNYVYAYPWIQLQKSYSAFFRKKARHPKFRAKHRSPESFYVCHREMEFDGKTLHLGPAKFKLGPIRMHEELRYNGKVMGATIRRDGDRWMLSVQVNVGDSYRKERVSDGTVGVDLGITTLATLSTGEKVAGPKPLRRSLKKLQRCSRQHSRKKRGSNNREKSRRRLAKLHKRVRNIRKDAIHRLTTKLCRENQAVVIEDLSVRGMMRNARDIASDRRSDTKSRRVRCLARHIADMGWYELRRQLEYKCLIYGTKLTVADRFFPSSRTCSDCGAVRAELKLGERVFRCQACGLELDRDLNAAMNLLNLVARDMNCSIRCNTNPAAVPVNDGEPRSGAARPETPVERKALAVRSRGNPAAVVKPRLAEAGSLLSASYNQAH